MGTTARTPNLDQRTSTIPGWLLEIRRRDSDRYYSASGHAWLRFHKWALLRFPPHDVSRMSKAEERELFFTAKAPLISYHHLPDPGEVANSILYICRDKEYDISKLSANNRSKVRRGEKRFNVRRATAAEVAEKGYESYRDACTRNGIAPISEKDHKQKWRGDNEPSNRELWAAFAGDEIAAVGVVWICGRWAELFSTQSSNRYLKDYSNHVLFYNVLHDLLHREGIESVSYGLSTVQANSNMNSLHHFKLSVNFEAISVVRKIIVNPFLRPAFNNTTLRCARLLVRIFPRARHILAAKGALELMVGDSE